jgi:hypothetical protein
MAKKEQEDNRDIFDKVLDVAFPTAVALTGAYVGAKGGARVGGRIAKSAIKKDRAMGGNAMTREEAEQFTKTARRSMGAMGAMTVAPMAGIAAHDYRQAKKRRK